MNLTIESNEWGRMELERKLKLFESGNAAELKTKIQKLWAEQSTVDTYHQNCRDISFDGIEEYTEKLMKINKGK